MPQTMKTPTQAAQAELLDALRSIDTVRARQRAGEDVGTALADAEDRIDDARAVLCSLTGAKPEPGLRDRMAKRTCPPVAADRGHSFAKAKYRGATL